ncbi:DUF397 domain-containing protein [Streptomyces sp. WAC 04229]|uniref:DUF397 domain-containing protein n=1 Tax=Streptomyces sp. WAC 04229 TaxID=2203206 RepID=UPI000F73FED2|nr:DUF397 domain-containing protein [Streptomyces sp. WAC 04229]RSN48680.1 DUF397 domain-containing protein [Streptomyces sp. WAC 04229]
MNNAEYPTTAHGSTWFKSSYSGTEGGQCVEVATSTAGVRVRDSKAATGPVVTVSPEAWVGFVGLASADQNV